MMEFKITNKKKLLIWPDFKFGYIGLFYMSTIAGLFNVKFSFVCFSFFFVFQFISFYSVCACKVLLIYTLNSKYTWQVAPLVMVLLHCRECSQHCISLTFGDSQILKNGLSSKISLVQLKQIGPLIKIRERFFGVGCTLAFFRSFFCCNTCQN